MPTFIYKARNERGQIASGTVEAEDEKRASQILWENKLKVISLEPKPVAPKISFFNTINVGEKALFARQLSTMISAGIHLPIALNVCMNQTKNKRFKEILERVIKDVETGYSLSSSLAKYPEAFDKVFVSVVKAGEATGKLDQVLISLADRMEKDNAFKGKVKSAMIYPAFIVVVMIIVGALMMIKVIPQLRDIFEESGVRLPWATRALLWTSNFLVQYWWAVILFIALLIIFARYYLKTEQGRQWWNDFVISIPGFGEINRNIIMARFARTFTLLIRTGIPILDTLHILSDVMDNDIYKKSLYQIAAEVERGIPLSVPLKRDKHFPLMISQMVEVGEQSGSLDQILDRLGVFYENKVDEETKTIGSLIEPLVIVLLGFGVGVLIFAVLMPIYQIAQIQ